MWINKDVAYLDNIIAEQEQVTQDVEVIDKYRPVNIYPFRIVSGFQMMTNKGEVDTLTNINKEGQYANYATGENQITVYWEGSTTLTTDGLQDKITETLKVGRVIKALASDEGLLAKNYNLSTVNLYGIDYTTTETQNTLSLFFNCDDRQIENKQWTFIDQDENGNFIADSYVPTDYDIQNYVYLILDPRYQSYQWLRMKNVTYAYQNETRRPVSCLVEFETINNDFTNTGKSIIQYFQHGTPNESYAFPLETYDQDGNAIVELDTTHINLDQSFNEGVDSIQIDHLGGYALSSVGLIGRKVDNTSIFELNNNQYTRTINTPQTLLLLQSQKVVESPFINRTPIQNVYAAYDMYNDVRGVYKSYQEAFGTQSKVGTLFNGYNVTASKQIITGMRPKNKKWTDIKNTNKLTEDEGGNAYYASTTWFTDGMNNDYWINPIKQPSYLEGVPNYIYNSSGGNISIPQFLNINHLLNWGIDELTTNYTQSTKYKLTSVLGILGNIFNTIVNGLDFGWIKNKTLKQGQTFNVLLPCEVVENQEAVGTLDDSTDNALPLDYFNDQLATKSMPVNSNLYTAFKFSLTHLFENHEFDSKINTNRESYKNVGGGAGGIWDTRYLGQTTDENGEWLLNDKSQFKPNPYQMVPVQSDSSYLVDWISIKGVGICDRRIAMFKNIYQEESGDYLESPIYQLIAQTKSKVKNNITLWADSWKFNYYDQFNTFGHLRYPIQDIPANPIIDTEKNRIIKIDKQKMFIEQVGTAQRKKTFENNLIQSFPLLTNKTNFNKSSGNVLDTRAWNKAMWYYTDNATIQKGKEQNLQSYSGIQDFNMKIRQKSLNSNERQTTFTQTYKLSDVSYVYKEGDWATSDTVTNARTKLDALELQVALNTNTDQAMLDHNYIAKIKMVRDEVTHQGDLDKFFNGEEVVKPIEIINTKDTPISFNYPMMLFGDYYLPNSPKTFNNWGQNRPRGIIMGSGSWKWLTTPKRIFEEQNKTYTSSTDYMSNFQDNYGFNTTKEIYRSDSQSNYILSVNRYNNNHYENRVVNNRTNMNNLTGYDAQFRAFRSTSIGHMSYMNIYAYYTNVTRAPFLQNGWYYSAWNLNGWFQNYKPTPINSTKQIKATGTISIKLENNNDLTVKITNLNVELKYNGVFSLEQIKNAFTAILQPKTEKRDNTDYYATPPCDIKQSQITNSSYKKYEVLGSNGIALNGETSIGDYKGGAFFFNYTEMNGNNYIYPVNSDDGSGTIKTTAISPTFYWADYVANNWNTWLTLSNKDSGDKTGQIQYVVDAQQAATKNNNFLNKISSSEWEYNLDYPIAIGGMGSGLKNWPLDGEGSAVLTYGAKFQYDPDLNFLPIIAFDLNPTWKPQ